MTMKEKNAARRQRMSVTLAIYDLSNKDDGHSSTLYDFARQLFTSGHLDRYAFGYLVSRHSIYHLNLGI